MSSHLTRRDISGLLFAALAVTLWQRKAVASALQGALNGWVREMDAMARGIAAGAVSTPSSQQTLDSLLRAVDLDDLTAAIDLERLIQGIRLPERGETDVVSNLAPGLRFKTEITALNRDRSIPPHAHNNQMTAHLVLRGELRARHFDREDQEDKEKILTPTVDRSIRRGDFSTMSDDKDNVHWFTAQGGPAFLFNVVVSNLMTRPGFGVGRQKLDLRGGEMPDGRIRAKGIDLATWLDVYG